MYGEGFNIYLFYCFFYIEERRLDALNDQLGVERYPNLEVNKDFLFLMIGENTKGVLLRINLITRVRFMPWGGS